MNKINLLIADDHAILRDGVVSLLRSEPSFEITGTASNGYEVLELITSRAVDVCLLDINMPGLDGIETARLIRQRKPEIKIIMLTTYNDREIISELVHIGVAGYLLKNSDKEELAEAIHKVMKGRHYFSSEVENIILEGLTEKKLPDAITQLTDRELEVVQLLAKEYTNDKIASELHISYRTVETHRKNIMQKTKAHNLAGLIKFAYSKGLLK
ncbi:MAG TPA: response regulator transcription factor [Chitinophagaceae bacterium]|nr:response regulator transcription factor [Chitinophagaceae bacterium]